MVAGRAAVTRMSSKKIRLVAEKGQYLNGRTKLLFGNQLVDFSFVDFHRVLLA
jgi:hypothetical protein